MSAGTAWLVADRARGDYLCYLYGGWSDDTVLERGRVESAPAAVAWGRARTTRVRIRVGSGETYWAGSAPMPEGITLAWTDDAA